MSIKNMIAVWSGRGYLHEQAESVKQNNHQAFVEVGSYEYYQALGVVDGAPGVIGDEVVARMCHDVERDVRAGVIDGNQAYNRCVDIIQPLIWNYHTDGVAAHEANALLSQTLDVIQGFRK